MTCIDITLDANEIGYILVTGNLNILPPEGLTLTNTGEIWFGGREFYTGNNIFVLNSRIPGLADLTITKEVT